MLQGEHLKDSNSKSQLYLLWCILDFDENLIAQLVVDAVRVFLVFILQGIMFILTCCRDKYITSLKPSGWVISWFEVTILYCLVT